MYEPGIIAKGIKTDVDIKLYHSLLFLVKGNKISDIINLMNTNLVNKVILYKIQV